jgi:hypothetical protein
MYATKREMPSQLMIDVMMMDCDGASGRREKQVFRLLFFAALF